MKWTVKKSDMYELEINYGGREMAQQLKAHSVPSKDPSLLPSLHISGS